MAIYRNIPEIPVPMFATADKKSGEVSVYKTRPIDDRRYRIVIGKLLNNGKMHPNTNFKKHYPKLWAEHYGEESLDRSSPSLSVGLYAASLALSTTSGLYAAVQDAFGAETGNALMDFSLFSIEQNSNAAYLMPEYNHTHVTYSVRAKSDSWISRRFSEISIDEIADFKKRWILALKQKFDISKVWLAIDSTNDDCRATNSNIAAPGHSKSGNSYNIIGQIWAVATGINIPVTWFVNNGNIVDKTSFDRIFRYLASFDIEVEGFILDKGFNSSGLTQQIEEAGYNWIMMMSSNSYAHRQMLQKFSHELRWNVKYRAASGGLFGMIDKQPLFNTSEKESYIGLYFSGANGADRLMAFLDKSYEEVEFLNPRVSSKFVTIIVSTIQ